MVNIKAKFEAKCEGKNKWRGKRVGDKFGNKRNRTGIQTDHSISKDEYKL
jgi:hypothetical protein